MKILETQLINLLKRRTTSRKLVDAFKTLKYYLESVAIHFNEVDTIDIESEEPLFIVYYDLEAVTRLLFAEEHSDADRLIAEYLNSKQIVIWLRAYLKRYRLVQVKNKTQC